MSGLKTQQERIDYKLKAPYISSFFLSYSDWKPNDNILATIIGVVYNDTTF